MADLPKCGLYRTTRAIVEGVPEGRLVYFHNHGNPGPGVYLPASWAHNRARFHDGGFTLKSPAEDVKALSPLLPEGLYRVREAFDCCEKKCRTYPPGQLVQLGYNGHAEAILFVPEWTEAGLSFPSRGSVISGDGLSKLDRCAVPDASAPHSHDGGGPVVH